MYNVVDVGEVAPHVAVVEDLDGEPFADLLGKAVIGHVGASPRAVDGEVAEGGDGEAVEVVVGVGHHFIGFFGRAVEVGGLVGGVFDAKGDFLVQSVDGRGRGVDEFELGEKAANFQNRYKAVEIGIDVVIGLGEGVADAGLRGQVDDVGDSMA